MKKTKTLYTLLLLCTVLTLQAQQAGNTTNIKIPVLSFQQFEPTLYPVSSDTIYVINFWATWCAPCIKELPYFEELGSKYADQKVKVILVSLDFKNQVESRVIPFIKRKQIKSKVVVLSDPDANAWIDKVDPSWSGALPATMIIKGNKREFHERIFTSDELESLITNYL